jgi:hypothetical protein
MNWHRIFWMSLGCAYLANLAIFLVGFYTIPHTLHDCIGLDLSPEQIRALNFRFLHSARVIALFTCALVSAILAIRFGGGKK